MACKKSSLSHCLTAQLKIKTSPGWGSSVDRAPACKPKGHWFDSQLEHMPGLQARSPVVSCERQPHIDVSLPLPPPFPSLLKINKVLKRKKKPKPPYTALELTVV